MLNEGLGLPLLIDSDSETESRLVAGAFRLFVVRAEARSVFGCLGILLVVFKRDILVPSRQVFQDELQKPAQVLRFAHGAREYQRTQPICVEQSIKECHVFEDRGVPFVQGLDEAICVFCVRRRKEESWQNTLL